MKNAICYLGALLLALSLAVGCGRGVERIVIVSTNDMHSSIDAFPSLATLVESERAQNEGRFLLIDAGDRWTGNPYVDMSPEEYKPIIDLMNELGYDIATFGNHEWDKGTELLAKRTREASFEKILANADMSGSPMEAVESFTYREIGGLRMIFLGLVTVDPASGHPVGMTESYAGCEFYDPWQMAAQYAHLKDSCDLLVGLTHIGFEEDSLLAVQRPEFGLIIGGHSHTTVPQGRLINRTVVTQTGSKLRYAGVTTISHRGGQILTIDNRLVKLDTIPPSPRFRAMVDAIEDEPSLQQKIGENLQPLNKIGLMSLFTNIMCEETSSDFAFHNLGGMRIDTLPQGDIRKVDIYSAEPFGNSVVTHMMTLEEVKDLIINKFNSAGKESHSIDLYPGNRLAYEVITNSDGNATDVIFKVKSDKKRYKIALSNYVSESYDFAQRGKGAPTGIRIATMVEQHIRKHPKVNVADASYQRATVTQND